MCGTIEYRRGSDMNKLPVRGWNRPSLQQQDDLPLQSYKPSTSLFKALPHLRRTFEGYLMHKEGGKNK